VTAVTKALGIIRWLSALFLFSLLLAEITRRGAFLRTPATIAANSRLDQPSLDQYLLFLGEARRRIPPGATVAVVPQAPGELAIGTSYLLALSQMPDQTILPATSLGAAGASGPEWVMTFGAAVFDDPRFRFVAAARGGSLFQAIR
jgi:hypothetical protein